LAFTRAAVQDGVFYTKEEKNKIIERRLKKADKDVDRILKTTVDLIKQIIAWITGIVLTIMVSMTHLEGRYAAFV